MTSPFWTLYTTGASSASFARETDPFDFAQNKLRPPPMRVLDLAWKLSGGTDWEGL